MLAPWQQWRNLDPQGGARPSSARQHTRDQQIGFPDQDLFEVDFPAIPVFIFSQPLPHGHQSAATRLLVALCRHSMALKVVSHKMKSQILETFCDPIFISHICYALTGRCTDYIAYKEGDIKIPF